MKLFHAIKNFFAGRQPTLGASVFESTSWRDKHILDFQRNQLLDSLVSLGPVREQTEAEMKMARY